MSGMELAYAFLYALLIRAERKLQAIKICRELTGLGLKETKDIVEATEPLDWFLRPSNCSLVEVLPGIMKLVEIAWSEERHYTDEQHRELQRRYGEAYDKINHQMVDRDLYTSALQERDSLETRVDQLQRQNTAQHVANQSMIRAVEALGNALVTLPDDY